LHRDSRAATSRKIWGCEAAINQLLGNPSSSARREAYYWHHGEESETDLPGISSIE